MNERADDPADSPPQRAERVRAAMYERDYAGQSLGIEIAEIAPGSAAATMTVRRDMLNGFAMCHGGLIVTLADTAFAYACNSYDEMTLAAGLDAEFLKGARLGDALRAEAREQSQAGRLGVYDVSVRNQHGELVALLRGRSYRLRGKPVTGG
jgi:acyl-CoA thioesterase